MIKISHVTKDYGKGRGVFDLCFEVEQGEVMGYLGPNGAGKTTTIRQLMGFIRPDSGEMRINGLDCFRDADRIQKSVGYLPGEIAFMDSMRGDEFIRFAAKIKNMKDLGRAKELMERFDLDASGRIRKMSKGMKQKIGLVCAFMADPEILILDEPTSGLDPLMQNQFVELILEEKERGKTILMSSHMFEEIEKTCSRAAIIKDGHLVAVEEMEKLKAGRQKILEVTFKEAAMAEAFAKIKRDSQVKIEYQPGDRRVVAKVGRNMDDFVKQLGNYTVTDIDVQTQSLEEFFLNFYGEASDAERRQMP